MDCILRTQLDISALRININTAVYREPNLRWFFLAVKLSAGPLDSNYSVSHFGNNQFVEQSATIMQRPRSVFVMRRTRRGIPLEIDEGSPGYWQKGIVQPAVQRIVPIKLAHSYSTIIFACYPFFVLVWMTCILSAPTSRYWTICPSHWQPILEKASI